MIKVVALDKGALKIESSLVVSDQQREKLHTKQARNMWIKKKRCLLKDMNIDHAWVTTDGDQTKSVISVTSTSDVDDTFFLELETKHLNYLSEVDKIELNKQPTTTHNDDATFVKELLEHSKGAFGVTFAVHKIDAVTEETMTVELWTDLLKTYIHANSFK